MNQRTVGWLFVAAQAILIGALALMPSADHFAVPSWLRSVATALFCAGVVISVIACGFLGRSLTATPVPTSHATLRTSGPYRYVRHPIYTGVVLIVIAMSARSGSVFGLAVGAATVGFFHWKAAWEEQRLRDRFSAYAHYASTTPRFLPRIRTLGRTRPRTSRASRT